MWRSNPDTVCFWLDAFMNAWDHFIVNSRHFEFVKRFTFYDDIRDIQILNHLTHNFCCFSQKEFNRFRIAVQVMDVATLDIEYALFERSKLAMAIILISILHSYDILFWQQSNEQLVQLHQRGLLEGQIKNLNLKKDWPIVDDIINFFMH